jgi:hypothetical protein
MLKEKFNYKKVSPKKLGDGVLLFEQVLDVDWDYFVEWASGHILREKENMYKPSIDPDTGAPCYINRSGYYFNERTVNEMPFRSIEIHEDKSLESIVLLAFIEDIKYKCLLQYIMEYPMLFKCIWWRSKGHVVSYGPGSYLGPHSDNSCDYIFGLEEPKMQLAAKNVVGSIVYVNDDYIGGEHYFNYLNIKYKPKKGDILMFPSNYIATHQVLPVESGVRYSYLGWYGHGSANEKLREKIYNPLESTDIATRMANLYLPFLREDLANLASKDYANNQNAAEVLRLVGALTQG